TYFVTLEGAEATEAQYCPGSSDAPSLPSASRRTPSATVALTRSPLTRTPSALTRPFFGSKSALRSAGIWTQLSPHSAAVRVSVIRVFSQTPFDWIAHECSCVNASSFSSARSTGTSASPPHAPASSQKATHAETREKAHSWRGPYR